MSHSPMVPPGYGHHAPKKSNTGCLIAGILGGALLLFGGCSAVVVALSPDDPVEKSGRDTLTFSTSSPKGSQKPVAPVDDLTPEETTEEPPEPAKPVTVLTASGNGIKKTKRFTVDDSWELRYSFNCDGFSYTGMTLYEGSRLKDVLVNTTEDSGSDTTPVYEAGTFYLSVNSGCDWKVKVVDIP